MRFSYSVRGIGGAIVGAALSLIGSTAPIQAQESSAVVSVSSANLRANPSLQGAIVGRVVRGDTVLHLASRDDGWSLVRTGRKEGWVRSSFLVRTTTPEAPAKMTEESSSRVVDAVAPSPDVALESSAEASITNGDDVDPRLAGRGRARANGKSTIPASRDPSRLGAMGGMASGYYFQTFDYLGPAVRAYARVPMRDAPLAMRADLEFSRVSARNLGPGDEHSLTDVRAILGAEFGVPVSDALEVFVVGGLGLSRITDRLRLVDMQFEAQQTDWSLAHDIGLGVKVGRLLILESHFFAGGGAPARLLAGVRL